MIDNAMLKRVGIAAGVAIATSFSTLIVLTIISLPASYMMNRIIYHHWGMRLLVGLATVPMSFFIFVALVVLRVLGVWNKVHYFGFFPIANAVSFENSGSIVDFLYSIYLQIINPITYTGDKGEFAKGIENAMNLLPRGSPGAVNEELFEKARQIAGMAGSDWSVAMEDAKRTLLPDPSSKA